MCDSREKFYKEIIFCIILEPSVHTPILYSLLASGQIITFMYTDRVLSVLVSCLLCMHDVDL